MTKSPRSGNVLDKYVPKGGLIEGLQEPGYHSMRSYWSTHPGATAQDLASNANALQELQKRTNVHSQKASDHRHKSKNLRGRRKSSASSVNVIKTGGSTLHATALPTGNASAVMQIVSGSPSIPIPATLRKNESSPTYAVLATFRVCLDKSPRQAQ